MMNILMLPLNRNFPLDCVSKGSIFFERLNIIEVIWQICSLFFEIGRKTSVEFTLFINEVVALALLVNCNFKSSVIR